MPELKPYIEKAKMTGRCIFIGGEYSTDVYPSEPIQASDISVSLLWGGTIALESYLSGVKSVYLDLEGLCSFDEYNFNSNNIVFDNVDKLINAINSYRDKPDQLSSFADISKIPSTKLKDNFCDGKAINRMSSYLKHVLDGYQSSINREDIISSANRFYAEAWGNENVISKRELKVDYESCTA